MARRKIYILAALIVALAFACYYAFSSHGESGGLPGVFAADTKFQPLDIREPSLRIDLLTKIRKTDYPDSQRNIFVAAPPPPPKPTAAEIEAQRPFIGPRQQVLPPVQVPAEFFGYAAQPHAGRRVGFFTSGDDVLVVAEGGTFLNRFRLLRINNDNADVEEISTGRHVTLPMVQPPDQGAAQ
jgi:hypothetical protein